MIRSDFWSRHHKHICMSRYHEVVVFIIVCWWCDAHRSMIDHLAPPNSHTVNVRCCVFQCGSTDCCSLCCQDRPASSIMDSAQLLQSTSIFLILTVSLCVVLQVTQKTLWNPTWMSRAIRLRGISGSPTWITCFDDLQKMHFTCYFAVQISSNQSEMAYFWHWILKTMLICQKKDLGWKSKDSPRFLCGLV